ncbi:pisatin demethylase [Fusarium piperis]|uniref:Pisatin demethylase n=1 Tax=Fusarium piperis TaxID=1435070 RepID=A0A9W9BPP5_9HYPO|nr:pisatin demethylase [Fusarium piperis]
MIDLHKIHGPIVQIAPNRYDFNTPQAVKTIYRIGNAFPKSRYYDPFGTPDFHNLMNALDNKDHAALRKQIASLYTMSALLSYEHSVDAQTNILKEKFLAFANRGETVDLPQFLQFYAFDVIGTITIGKSMGMMESNTDMYGTCQALDGMWHYIAVLGLIPGIHLRYIQLAKFLGFTPPTKALDSFIDTQIQQYTEAMERKGGVGNDADTFLARMLNLQEQGKATKKDTRHCVTINIGAGSDTTAIGLSSIVYYLYSNPRTLGRLREEFDKFAKAGELSNPISFEQAQKMAYLQAVIKEALRLHPGVGTQLTRVVPKGGAVIEGQFFPEGAEVGVNGWALYYNPDIFGDDASKFLPERWLQPGEDVRITTSFAFGAGPRSCLGKNVSILEMSKAIPQIVQNFDIEFEPKDASWKHECWWFVKPEYKAKIKLRDH